MFLLVQGKVFPTTDLTFHENIYMQKEKELVYE